MTIKIEIERDWVRIAGQTVYRPENIVPGIWLSVFDRLDGGSYDTDDIESLQKEIEDLEEQVSDLEKENDSLTEDNHELREEVSGLENEVENLEIMVESLGGSLD